MEGTGTMLVVAVGPHSQQGIIFTLMSKQQEDDDGKPHTISVFLCEPLHVLHKYSKTSIIHTSE